MNYSERLVMLLREVRQFIELGFRKQIPKQIVNIVETGKKYYKEALTLKQVANFYNTLSTQIIQSQQKMLVEEAINFEDVVKNTKIGKGSKRNDSMVTWDNPADLEQYIHRVQEAANKIMAENRKLRKVHLTLVDMVSQLFDIDLLKQRPIWKEKFNEIKRTIEICTMNRDQTLCKPWKIHWDFQIYKV